MSNEFWSNLNEKKKKELLESSQTQGSSEASEELKASDFWSALNEDKKRELLSSATTDIAPTRTFMQDDDIAPVKGGNKNSVFKSGGFSDGVDGVGDFFGDLGQTVLGTTADLGLGILKGAGRLVEGIVDLGTYGVAGVADLFGADKFAEKTKKVAQYSATDEWTKGATDYVDQYSVLGNKADMVSEGLGQVLGIVATGGAAGAAGLGTAGATALTTGVTFASGMGSGMNEAYEMGASDGSAVAYGATSGAVEAISEMIFGGLGKGSKALGVSKGLTSIDDVFAKKMSNAAAKFITSEAGQKVVGNTLEYAVKSGAEGLEEVISGFGSAIAKDAYLMNGEDEKAFGEILKDENLLEQFVVGSIVSGIAQSGDAFRATRNGRDFVSGLSKNEQTVVDKVFEQRLAEESENRTLSNRDKNKLYERVVEEMKRGYVTTDEIESILGGETYKGYKDLTDKKNSLEERKKAIEEEIKSLVKTPESQFTIEQREKLTSLREEARGIKDELQNLGIKTAKNNLFNEVDKLTSKDTYLRESYNEIARKGQAFEADLTKYAGKQREAIERAVKSGVLNNTNRSHELVDTLSKIEADKGIVFDYTNNAKLKESGFAIEGKTVNGFVKDGGVTLNVQSQKAWQSTVGHEITHVLEGTESYGALQQALFEYAESKGEYQSRYDSLAELYNGVKGYETDFEAKIKKELTADLVGDYLFTDKDFINRLTSNRTLFQKVYDEIKYLCKVATGKEKADIEKVKREFDRAWEEMSADKIPTTGETRLSMSGKSSKTADNSLLAQAEHLLDTGVDSETVRQETGWYKGYDGQWRYEIDDSTFEFHPDGQFTNPDVLRYRELQKKFVNGEITENEFKEMQSLTKVLEGVKITPDTLGDVVSHKELFEAYPQLKNVKFTYNTLDKKTLGSYSPSNKTITLNNNLIGDNEAIKNTLIHEIQHAIQDIEGFAQGASVEYWKEQRQDIVDTISGARANLDLWLDDIGYPEFAKSSMQEVANREKTLEQHWEDCKEFKANSKYAKQIALCEAELAEFQQQYDEITNGMTVYEQYRNTAGEIEARDATNRLNLNAEQRKNTRPDIDRSDVVFAEGNRTSAEIVTLDNGKQYVRASEKQVISGDDTTQWANQVADFINKELRNWDDFEILTVEGDVLTLTRDTAYKAGTRGDIKNPDGTYRAMTDAEYRTKLNAEIHINELAEVSKKNNKPPKADKKKHRFAKDGFTYRTAYFEDYDGEYYRITISIGHNGDVATVYNVGKIKKDSLPNGNIKTVLSGSKPNSSSLSNSIAQLPENVNTQFSLSREADTDYMSAVERGDTETAQKIVDEAAKNAGYNIKAYHGTGYDFTVFDKSKQGDNYQDWGRLGKGFYFAPTSREAETWAEHSRGSLNKVMPVYLRSENMLDSFEALPDNLKDTIPENWDSLTRRLAEKYAYNYIEYMQEFGYNVQQILTEKGYDGINGHTEFVVYDPEQVKSADTVTYDDKGNVIPLSQRFDSSKVDIRNSLSDGNEVLAPYGDLDLRNIGVPLKDVALEQDIAPVAEGVAKNATTTTDAPMPSNSTPKSAQIANGTRGDNLLVESLDNYPMETVEQKVAENIRAIEGELADNRDLRREAEANYNSQIAKLQKEYNSKKNKETKVAYELLQSISRLERLKASTDAKFAKRISDLEARVEKMKDPQYSRAMYKRAKMEEHAKFAEDLIGDTSTWVDKKLGLQYATNTERRNLRDIVRDENGNADIARADAINDALNGQYNRNQAERNRKDNEISQKYRDLKVNRHESVYANMLGELRHNPETTLTEKDVNEYYEEHKNKIDTKKVDKFIDYVRSDLDYFFESLNTKLREQGMKEIPYRKGYFPHKVEPKQNFIQKLLNWKTQDTEIPTSIAGLTEDFKPVKSYQSFDKQRHSDETDYDLMRLFQNYKNGALDWIYHLEDIQKRRAVENYIRYTHSEEGIQARIKEVYANEDFDADEAQAEIEKILTEAKNPLNNFVQDFTTHTNILAGKKNSLDRTTEQMTNRKIYSVMQNVQNRTSANMVLANIRSALTNFIPITQSWAQVSPLRSIQATKDTIANAIKDDGLINKSTFLTNRLREADSLYKTNWDKVLDKAGIMFEVVDNFSSQVIWRSKYNQNLDNGMTEAEAIANADQFAENVMAGRSKGNEPTLFNAKNPLVKAFTMFQLEVNNQYGYLFKDVPNDLKAETEHWKLNLAKGYTTAFVGAYVYNALLEQVTGSGAALDPIGIIEDLLKDLGLFDDDEEKEFEDAVINFGKNVAQEIPFIGGYLGGGRVPISSAIPYSGEYSGGFSQAGKDVMSAVGAVGDFIMGDGDEADWSGAKNLGKELLNPLLNVGLPVGGGQLKKTMQGLNMFSDEHPVAGSYTDSGALRFPVEDTLGNRIQAGLFGQYANENAREYFDNGYAPLKEKQIQEYQDVDLPIADYWKYREGLGGLKTNAEKADYIDSLDIEDWQKNLLLNNILDRKEDVDMSNYDDFSDWDEFDYAQKNPDKYAFAKSVGGYSAYKTYSDELYDIKADKDEYGKSISGSRKDKVLNYINNLDADYETKIILWKSEYPSDDTYNMDIINYINNRTDLTYDERVAIFTELGFTVSNGSVYWD